MFSVTPGVREDTVAQSSISSWIEFLFLAPSTAHEAVQQSWLAALFPISFPWLFQLSTRHLLSFLIAGAAYVCTRTFLPQMCMPHLVFTLLVFSVASGVKGVNAAQGHKVCASLWSAPLCLALPEAHGAVKRSELAY